jgi:hypothetical protein
MNPQIVQEPITLTYNADKVTATFSIKLQVPRPILDTLLKELNMCSQCTNVDEAISSKECCATFRFFEQPENRDCKNASGTFVVNIDGNANESDDVYYQVNTQIIYFYELMAMAHNKYQTTAFRRVNGKMVRHDPLGN